MYIFRVKLILDEKQFSTIKKDSENIDSELKDHIYQQIIEQIKRDHNDDFI